jgi:aerobic carbon-monoxide dehydrogenase large subunit
MFYGVGGAHISAQDGATLRLDAKGAIICQSASPNRARARRR